MSRTPSQQPCRYFPCKCFSLGSGISCQVFNALYNSSGQFRVGATASSSGQPNPQNKVCAAKQINADHAATKYAQIEIDILKSLQHPNIVGLLDVVAFSDGKIALFMERCDGNLDQLIKKPENYWGLPAPLLLSLVSQYTEGFRYLYDHNVVHRDIKPLNILFNINSNGHITASHQFGRRDEYIFKLADFGVAKKTNGNESQNDVLKSLVGTPEFLCPEVLRGRYGSTADLWSAAVMFYYTIAGHLPFIGRDFHSKFSNYLMLLASSRKYEDIAAYCSSSDLSQIEFSSTLPQYCQLFGRLRVVFEKLLRLMLSPALNKTLDIGAGNVGPHDSLVVGSQAALESSKKMFEKFFEYVTAITRHCWFHVFDINTFTVSIAHVAPEMFSKPDIELVQALLDATIKTVGEGRILEQIGGSSTNMDAFMGKLVFEGGLCAFRSRFMSGSISDWRKTLLICSSKSTSNQPGSNPLRSSFDSLMAELFIKRELDFSRLPKATAQFFERSIFLIQTGIFPVVSSHRASVFARVDASKRLIRMSNLPEMLSSTFYEQLDQASKLLNESSSESDQKRLESFTAISTCYARAQALAHQCDVYASINPVQSGSGHCAHVSSSAHRDLTQLVVSATSVGRADINKQRMKVVLDFLGASDTLLSETFKTLSNLTQVLEVVENMETQLFDLCVSQSNLMKQAVVAPRAIPSNESTLEPGIPQGTLSPVSPSPVLGGSIFYAGASSLSLKEIEESLGSLQAEPNVKRSLAVLLQNMNLLQEKLSKRISTEIPEKL